MIGKRHGLPIWQILGGKYRDAVRIYADCHAGEALESIDCMLTPAHSRMDAGGSPEAERKSVVSLKHHGWDASGDDHLTADAYAARAQEMVATRLLAC